MSSVYENETVAELEAAIVGRVLAWYGQCGEAIPFAFVSRAFNKRAARLGTGLDKVLMRSVDSGVLGVTMTKRGGYMVYPIALVKEEYGEDGFAAFLESNGMKR